MASAGSIYTASVWPYNTKDQEYDIVDVNGDKNLENLRQGDQTSKVRLTEDEFGRLMFEVEDE